MNDLKDVAEGLYALTPGEFTAARNERAKQVRTQDRALADVIKALPKPSMAAWVVNMLVRHRAEQIDQVLSLGVALRQAQEDLDGEQLRDLTRQRRQLTAAVTTQARTVAADLDVVVTEAVATQVEETLRAAMTDEGAARAVRTGQLVEALTATGIGELDVSARVAVPEAIGQPARPAKRKRAELTVVEDEPESAEAERTRARDEAQQVAAAAEAEAAKSRKKLDKARKRVAKLEARSLQLQGELEEGRRRAGELEHDLETTDDELATAEEKRDRAEKRTAAAQEAADRAKDAVRRTE